MVIYLVRWGKIVTLFWELSYFIFHDFLDKK